MDAREHVRALVEASPDGTVLTVPRAWLAALLGDAADIGPVDLTVADLATRYQRSPSTVRWWLEQGRMPGAYRLQGREWRVPRASLVAFEAAERERQMPTQPPSPAPAGPPVRRAKVVDLGDWRRVG
ncbi:MAG: helix-turn-helix domain-containing protein [Gemmatimonadales bacterium]|nr:helix-turn-helix domain-containing protein [Gemmatimonadales bacterium]